MDETAYMRTYASRGAVLGAAVGSLLAVLATIGSGPWRPMGAAVLSAWLGFPFALVALPLLAVALGWLGPLFPVLTLAFGWACWGAMVGGVRDGLARQARRNGSRPAV